MDNLSIFNVETGFRSWNTSFGIPRSGSAELRLQLCMLMLHFGIVCADSLSFNEPSIGAVVFYSLILNLGALSCVRPVLKYSFQSSTTTITYLSSLMELFEHRSLMMLRVPLGKTATTR